MLAVTTVADSLVSCIEPFFPRSQGCAIKRDRGHHRQSCSSLRRSRRAFIHSEEVEDARPRPHTHSRSHKMHTKARLEKVRRSGVKTYAIHRALQLETDPLKAGHATHTGGGRGRLLLKR